ncbi:hypothetical protein [Dyella caseinilytica]|uniref:Uncharacterized protein n=1 Tax=Dyella caseinilytica TaxID=1849581 RepID=A0ABX7GU75_9GAMM|nr:hypothetical protein [Dyella caseinilytica]QRN53608.1 hypothetical protein ISN74_19745 [Dyella caseinilytica]
MSDELSGWQLQGRVSLWRYVNPSRSFCGWHLSADDAACKALMQLISYLSESSADAYRTIIITPPTERVLGVVNARSAAVQSISKLRLSYSSTPDSWSFVTDQQICTLIIGEMWWTKLADAIELMSRGTGDFCIGPKRSEDQLWFWWWPK